jgi:hypothetical protein
VKKERESAPKGKGTKIEEEEGTGLAPVLFFLIGTGGHRGQPEELLVPLCAAQEKDGEEMEMSSLGLGAGSRRVLISRNQLSTVGCS